MRRHAAGGARSNGILRGADVARRGAKSEELVALDLLLNEIRDRVCDQARTKDVRVVVVGVPQEVVVSRARVVRVVTALLRDSARGPLERVS